MGCMSSPPYRTWGWRAHCFKVSNQSIRESVVRPCYVLPSWGGPLAAGLHRVRRQDILGTAHPWLYQTSEEYLFLSILCWCISHEKKKKMEEGYNPLCRAWSTASPRAKVYEHRGRHHCWRACWQLSSPLHPESSINLHIYFLRNQKGGSAE